MRRVKALLQDSFRGAVSLNDVAQVAGVHPSHVAREFHRIYGMTVGDYIRKLRVEFVAERLIHPHKDTPSLTDLALCAGFSSHAHMAAMFKSVTGMTPTEYRKAHELHNPLTKAQFPERQGLRARLGSPRAWTAATRVRWPAQRARLSRGRKFLHLDRFDTTKETHSCISLRLPSLRHEFFSTTRRYPPGAGCFRNLVTGVRLRIVPEPKRQLRTPPASIT